MATIFDPQAADVLVRRSATLRPEAAPSWGRLTAPRMLSHVTDQIRQALGDIECSLVPGPLTHSPINWFVIHVAPWPKGKAKSPSQFLEREALAWPSDLDALATLIRRANKNRAGGSWAVSPVFGRISGRDWGVLIHRHLDHHLTQFGV